MTDQYLLLNCVPATVRDRQRYVGDHVIRHYRPLGLAVLLRDLGADPIDQLTIEGGIGTLTMYANGREDWKPTLPGTPSKPNPPPRQADPGLAAARRAICASCHAMEDRCTAAGCGCAGEGKPGVWSSRCPLGHWPVSHT